MLTSKVRSLAFILCTTACLWSCGDDDDSTGPTGGTAGKGGAGNKGGTTSQGGVGGAKGGAPGSGGKGGAPSGGMPGSGGKASGGMGPMGGVGPGGAGAGGMGAMGGEDQGGMGGMAGMGAMGGMGGEGGAAPLTLADYCASVCSHVPTNCSVDAPTPCVDRCTGYSAEGGGTDDVKIARLHAEYEALLNCLANKVISSSGYVCRDSDDAIAWWTPAPDGACEQQLCTWTIDDQFNAAPEVFDRCCSATPKPDGCP